jgi:hypothetical protein
MKRGCLTALFGLCGYVAGYFVGVVLLCSSPNASNLCGLPAAFITGPLGSCAAIWAAGRLGRNKS